MNWGNILLSVVSADFLIRFCTFSRIWASELCWLFCCRSSAFQPQYEFICRWLDKTKCPVSSTNTMLLSVCFCCVSIQHR